MNSIFSFLRRRVEARGGEPPAEPVPDGAPMSAAPRAPIARALTTNNSPPLDQVLAAMLDVLDDYLPPPVAPLPEPRVLVVRLSERAVGLGDRRGTETRGPFAVVALKGGRLDAVVRFQLWGDNPSNADTAIEDLQGRLLAARDDLWAAGFLRVAAEETSLAEHIATLNAWRRTTDYRILYEFHYQDTDGADSLIARIPIDIDSEYGESTVVTDEMVRWDNEAAPALEVRGGVPHAFRVGALFILAFLPGGWNGSGVTVSAAVAGAVRERAFASVRAFLDAFTLDTGTVELGGNPYRAGRLVFPNADFPDPITLKGGDDIFRVSYAAPAFNSDAIVYLRVLS